MPGQSNAVASRIAALVPPAVVKLTRSQVARYLRALAVTGGLAVAIGACGSGGAATNSRSEASGPFVQVSSTYCTASASCTFVFSDGRRFACPARFGLGPAAVNAIEHAIACKPLARLVISAPLRAVGARIERVRACLIGHGLRTIGGVVLPPQDHGSPAGELDTGAALIAFYTDRQQASMAVPAIVKNVKRFGGRVERAAGANIAWLKPPPGPLRAIVQACAAR